MGAGGMTVGECFYCGRATGDTSGHTTCNRIGPDIVRAERERVRFKLSTQETFDEVFDAIAKNIDGGYAVATHWVLDAIASRLGIDLRQPAGKGEG